MEKSVNYVYCSQSEKDMQSLCNWWTSRTIASGDYNYKHDIIMLPVSSSFIRLNTRFRATCGRQLMNLSTSARLLIDIISTSFLIFCDDGCFSRTSRCREVMQFFVWSSSMNPSTPGSIKSDIDCQLSWSLIRCFLSRICIVRVSHVRNTTVKQRNYRVSIELR